MAVFVLVFLVCLVSPSLRPSPKTAIAHSLAPRRTQASSARVFPATRVLSSQLDHIKHFERTGRRMQGNVPLIGAHGLAVTSVAGPRPKLATSLSQVRYSCF